MFCVWIITWAYPYDRRYSDSDSEAHHKKMAALPDWAQSPNLRKALLAQGEGGPNPDVLFGPIEPLRMEELFRTRTSQFKVRSSSANWHAGDGLTQKEAEEYAKKMGYKS
ncbi:hypothetical protein BT69DRAFT_1224601 [Atractiella rhizophila]|nr:hypothetical protein BT69DRAFT_1224601 [Atractiella rhizophila]